MQAKRMQRGFTLIELMIVVVVIGVLVAIGLPSYNNSVTRSIRADAQSALLGFAQAMERHFQQNYSYEAAAVGGNDTGPPDPTLFPSQAPIEGNNPSYDLTITAADDTGFTIRATPIAGGRQAGDGFIQLDSLGRRSWDADNDGTIGGNENTWDR